MRSIFRSVALALAASARPRRRRPGPGQCDAKRRPPLRTTAAAGRRSPARAQRRAAAEPQPNETNAQRAKTQPGNNAPFWRGVHNSGTTPGSVNNLQVGERGVLVQDHRSTPAPSSRPPARRGGSCATGGSSRSVASSSCSSCWRSRCTTSSRGRSAGTDGRPGALIERFTLLRARRALVDGDHVHHPRGVGRRDVVRQVLPAADPRRRCSAG